MSILSRSLQGVGKAARLALRQGNIEVALRIVHDFVERIITEPLCAARVFASRSLDDLCLEAGEINLSRLSETKGLPRLDLPAGPLMVYLVSRLQRSGGHSRLVQDFIRSQPEKNHLILSTEIAGRSDNDRFFESLSGRENVRFLRAPSGGFEFRLNWLQSILLSCRVEHVFLFNHHQDSVAVAAFVPGLELKGSFIHHGDHHLCLGVHYSHLVHLDLHPMGYNHCRHELGVDNVYLPLTFEDGRYESFETEFARGGALTTATAARSNKVEIPYYVSYTEFIPRLLKATSGRHLHVGKLTPWALRLIYRGLRENGINEDRFVYVEWAPSVWKALQEHKVDVYLASFPYGAGLTLVEAMGAGIPVILHEHVYSPILSGLELAYPEAYRWSDPDNLLSYLCMLQPERLQREKELSRLQYESFHRPEFLHSYLRDPQSVQLVAPEMFNSYRPRADEWAAWVDAELNFHHLLYRFVYRALRTIRRSMFS